jgi:hypothetical protein
MGEAILYVTTDGMGVQHLPGGEIRWPLPAAGQPGAPLPTDGIVAVFYEIDGLLEAVGERIFVAEREPARLVQETAWTLERAAQFALDCAEHAVFDADELILPSGISLGGVMRAARQLLDSSGTNADEARGIVQRISRLAEARRLRKMGDEVADVARQLTVGDEQADLDALDDGAFTSVASVRDAVLAAVETLRHVAAPELVQAREERYEHDSNVAFSEAKPIYTPWGSFIVGGPRGMPPASTSVREAAGRARQAVTDSRGPEEGAEERSWQLGRLKELLE